MNDMKAYFPYFEYNKDITYLDSANTSQILGSCLSSYIKYHYMCNYNVGRGSYLGAKQAQQIKDWAIDSAARFINAPSESIFYTTGATESLNIITYSFCRLAKQMKKKLVLLTTRLEHASAILPWMVLGKNCIDIKYIDTKEDYSIDVECVSKAIEEHNPDILLLASITNTTGEIRPIKEIGELTKEKKITFIVDHAQGAAHLPINVEECNIDFLAFSLHKMYGPKGVGVLYARSPKFIKPIKFGGGMNKYFEDTGDYDFLDTNDRMAAGTENVPAMYASIDAFEFLFQNWDEVKMHDFYLSNYAHKLLARLPHIKLYSKPNSSIILFNIGDLEPLDVMEYLSKKKIYIRGGNHCAKMTKDLFGLATCRASIGIYTTEQDIENLYKALKQLEDDVLCLKNNAQDQITAKLENVEQTLAH